MAEKQKKTKTVKKKAAKHAKESSKKSKRFIYVGVGLLTAALIAAGIFIGYAVYRQKKIDKYNRLVYEIKTQTSDGMADVDSYIESDTTSASAYAENFSGKFNEVVGLSQRAVLALKTLEPQNGSQRREQEKMITEYETSSALYEDLAALSGYILKREGILQPLVKELKRFTAETSKPWSRKRRTKRVPVRELAMRVAGKMKSAIAKIKNLKSSAAIYDDKLLARYAKTLGEQLKELDEKLITGSTRKIKAVINTFQEDYTKNWQSDFNKTDEKAFIKLSR